jgi:subtilisin family serine protease
VFEAEAVPPVTAVPPLDDLTPEWAWGGSTGARVKVAVIDSGVDAGHPALGGPLAGYVAFRQQPDGQLVADTQPHVDTYGHGTACAGIIKSLAPDCELYSVKVLGAGFGQGSILAAGLSWAIDNGMQVCNLSLGTTKQDYYAVLHRLADLAYFRNVALVTAANNRPVPSFPSTYASVLSVAAGTDTDPLHFYYNPAPPMEFGAPGIDVRVPWLDGSWLTTTGNSYAAPHVCGIVARILAKHPGLTVFQLKTVLRALAVNVRRDACAGRRDEG